MKEYKFQYTDQRYIYLLALACFLSVGIVTFLGIILSLYKSKQNGIPLILFTFLPSIVILIRFKKRAVIDGFAKLGKDSVYLELKNNSVRTINFNDLISYKLYNGKNGPVLYLKNTLDNFNISANSRFCKIESFQIFCNDVMLQLEKYKVQNPELIHEGSIFTKKEAPYILGAITFLYLALFFFNVTRALRLAGGIGVGLFLIQMWAGYYFENKKNQLKRTAKPFLPISPPEYDPAIPQSHSS